MARRTATTIGVGQYLYVIATMEDGSARVFKTHGETLLSAWYVDPRLATNPRIDDCIRRRAEAAIAEQREVIFGRKAA